IRDLHLPAENFRISKYKYPPGLKTVGTAHVGRVFVIQGCCRYEFKNLGDTVSLTAGEYCDLPGGGYELTVASDTPLEIMMVWNLRSLFPDFFEEQ
ncbi:MAG: hypothetical protein ACAI34_20260, partial [Verrucomicrobium sp.]